MENFTDFQQYIQDDKNTTLKAFEFQLKSRMATKIIKFAHANNMTVFGSYVREHLSHRTFDFETSDIDICSPSKEKDIDFLTKGLKSNGFRVTVTEADKYQERYGPFKVYQCKIGLINDEFIIGKKINIDVDFVHSFNRAQPPFGGLDFSCNAWIWDKHGIRISRNTGTEMDSLLDCDLQDKEAEILAESKDKIATYYPLVNEDTTHMDRLTIYRLGMRVERIVKMLRRGWKIINLDQFIEAQPDESDMCGICDKSLTDHCLKMSCCDMKCHHKCFIECSQLEIQKYSHARCVNCNCDIII